MATATMPDNDQFRPSDRQKRLEAEVEARRKRDAQKSATGKPDVHALALILEQAGLGEHKPQDLMAGLVEMQRQKDRDERRKAAREAAKGGLTDTQAEVTAAIAKMFHRDVELIPMTAEEIEAADQRLKKERQEAARELERQSMDGHVRHLIPERFRGTFDMRRVPMDVDRGEVRKVLEWKFGPVGLYIYGQTGRSKSWSMYALAERLIREGRTVLIFDGPAFSIAAGRAFSDPSTTERWLDTLVRPDVLIIDDLGKRWTPATEDAAFTVVDRRTARARPIITSVNYTGEELRAMSEALKNGAQVVRDITTPLRRRLKDYCQSVIF